MRYFLAIGFATAIVIAGYLFVEQTRRAMWQRVVDARTAAGETVDPAEGNGLSYQQTKLLLIDYGTELMRWEIHRIRFADLLTERGGILGPLVYVICVAGVVLFKPRQKQE